MASVEIEAPNPIVDQIPGAFVAEGEYIRLSRRGVDMADPVLFFPNGVAPAAVDRDADHMASGFGSLCFPEPDIASE